MQVPQENQLGRYYALTSATLKAASITPGDGSSVVFSSLFAIFQGPREAGPCATLPSQAAHKRDSTARLGLRVAQPSGSQGNRPGPRVAWFLRCTGKGQAHDSLDKS